MRSGPNRVTFVIIALAHFALRLHRLTAFPGFADEGNHVEWARAMWAGHYWLYPLAHGRGLSIVYLALFWPFESPLWVSRAATVLFSLLALAALYRAGLALFADRRLAGTACLVYATLPFAIFHERMALADAPAAALVAITLLQALATAKRPRLSGALLTAGLLAATLLTKLTAAGVVVIPWLALWLWRSPAVTWRRALALLGGSGALGVVVAGSAYAIAFRRYGVLGLRPEDSAAAPAGLAARLSENGTHLAAWLLAYGGWLILLGLLPALLAALVGRQRGALYLALALGVLWLPVVTLVSGPFSRYYMIGLPQALLLSLWGIFEALRFLKRVLTTGGRPLNKPVARAGPWLGAALVGLAVYGGVRFAATAYGPPADLPLPAMDRYTYLEAPWGTGYRFPEATEYVLRLAAENGTGRSLIFSGDQQVHWRALLYFPLNSPRASLYLRGLPDSPDLAVSVRGGTPVYLLWDNPAQAPEFPGLGVAAQLLRAYPRPNNTSRLEVYRLEPTE